MIKYNQYPGPPWYENEILNTDWAQILIDKKA